MAPRFRKLTKDMLKDIKFYTCSTEGISATLQYNLLKAKYSNNYINKKDVYNAIQRFRQPSRENLRNDAAETLKRLIALKAEDPNWVNRLNEEANYAHINEQKNMIPIIGLPHVASKYFPTIDSLIQEYLTLHVLSLQRQQLSEGFLYDAAEYFFDWNKNFQEPENVMEYGCLEDDYERRQIGLRSLLQNLRREDVLQTWVVTPQGSFSNSEEEEKIHKNMGEPQQAIEEREENENNVEQQVVVANPFVTKRRGRPPKRYRDALENITNSQNLQNSEQPEKRKNKCANCGDYDYNVRTCPI
ncbi:7185_t:CDS:2 [Cetraspora pellucida]|uniref:7185_t:CDS:1 n=1 Tax=Cetraspora pellucida TaxID=1433469 RepID=A0ACA9LSC6_9GLOM|nr:7185_t:CDS:2 [Cetraspora pellucida]